MKFATLCALVGAATAQYQQSPQEECQAYEAEFKQAKEPNCQNGCSTAVLAEHKAILEALKPFVEKCREKHGQKKMKEHEECDQHEMEFKQAREPNCQYEDNGCSAAQSAEAKANVEKLRPLVEACREKHEQKKLKEQGFDVESPSSTDGDIDASVNWQKLGDYSHHWADWFEGEAQSKEAQEIAMHLNSAAKKMVNTVAGGQADVVKNGGKLVGAFAKWVEPGSKCDQDAYVKCIQDKHNYDQVNHYTCNKDTRMCSRTSVYDPNSEVRPFHQLGHDLFKHCAKENDCKLTKKKSHEDKKAWKEAKHDFFRKDMRATKKAIDTMSDEIKEDVMGEMKSQKDNAKTVVKDFLTEAKERYTAWGCEPKCTERHTRHLWRLHGMKHCKCPATVTVSGDTSIIFH